MDLFCSNCKKKIDANTGVNTPGSPEPGSISICFYCGQVCIFQDDLTLKKITDEEMELIRMFNKDVYVIIRSVVESIKKKVAMN